MKDIKIACYGFVDKNSGSGGKAHFFILEELAERGVKIDFFGWRGYNRAEELECYPNFRYIDLPSFSRVNLFMDKLPANLKAALFPIVNLIFNDSLHFNKIQRTILAHHGIEHYDMIIFLGLCAPFRIKNLTNISWVQGPPRAEWDFIYKNRQTIVRLCGYPLYLKLKFYYFLKCKSVYSLKQTDIVICSSQWSKSKISNAGFDCNSIYVVPYPFELDRFSCKTNLSAEAIQSRKTLLHLGRLDPRKRLDLLLNAFTLVLQERTDVRLKIVGSFSYVPSYRQLIQDFPFPENLEYQDSVPQSQVPTLMQDCDLLIQPSEGENFGTAVAEALCCGLPVVVGPTNGTKDYLEDSSFVFEDYTPESLKCAILNALQSLDIDASAEIRKARFAAEKNFDVANVASSLQNIFAGIKQKQVNLCLNRSQLAKR